MHLSPLSENFLSDRFDDAGVVETGALAPREQAHRDGLLRGLALLAVIGVLVGLGFVSSAIHSNEADLAPYVDDVLQCTAVTCAPAER